MAEAPGTSIDASSPIPAASSPPSTPPDPLDEATPRLKSPWSQIVRGSPYPPRSKAEASSCNLQPDDVIEKHQHHHLPSELRVSDTAAAVVNASPLSSPSAERRQGFPEMPIEKSTVSPDRLINESVLVDSKPPQQSPAKSPKPAWGKPISNSTLVLEPEPVMGAVTWPALSEARNSKASESFKAGTTQKAGSKSPPLASERHHFQEPPLSHKEIGSTDQSEVIQKLSNQVMVNGSDPPSTVFPDTASPGKIGHPTDAEHSKWSVGRDFRNAAASEGSPGHSRGSVTSHTPNKESGRNFMWDQGRGNHSFPAYGRGHANTREHTFPGHHQRGGQRNLPPPFVPFVNPNSGFVHSAGYQSIPSSMYYMSAPTSEPVLGATYFVPSGVQGMFMHGPDIVTLQGLVVKQIEYYFSVENLCRDIYLRSKMDEWGFVPVSVIANFNRVKTLTQNPYFIIEALRLSNVLEVQGDKVRKKGDWANWLLPSSQLSNTSSRDRDHQAARFSTSSRKEVDGSKSDNLRSLVAENQSNGHSHLASRIKEAVEAHSVSAVNVQGGLQDSLSHEGTERFLEDKRSEDLQVLDTESEHFTKSCSVESGMGVE